MEPGHGRLAERNITRKGDSRWRSFIGGTLCSGFQPDIDLRHAFAHPVELGIRRGDHRRSTATPRQEFRASGKQFTRSQ